jgi:hypothetical protein
VGGGGVIKAKTELSFSTRRIFAASVVRRPLTRRSFRQSLKEAVIFRLGSDFHFIYKRTARAAQPLQRHRST